MTLNQTFLEAVFQFFSFHEAFFIVVC